MYIGIDDSGNFKNEVSYFTAVLVRTSQYQALKDKYRIWEKSTRKEFHINGELKGGSLPPEALVQFLKQIIFPNEFFIRIISDCVKPTSTKEISAYCILQKEIFKEKMTEAVEFYNKRDKGHSRIGNQHQNLKEWLTRLNDENLLKAIVLGQTMIQAFSQSIPYSVANNFDQELADLKIFIDECFLSQSNHSKSAWKDLVRSFLWQTTYNNPIPLVKEWAEKGHPFVTRFIDEDKGDKLLLSNEFQNCFDFYKSKEQVIIRLADICGAIIKRRYESVINERCYFVLNNLIFSGRIRELQFTSRWPTVPSPYDEDSQV